jgi:predicted MPP superfamily phosphohydrolase
VIVRVAEKAGYETVARATAYVGYLWLGFIFLFCSIALAVDICRLVIKLVTMVSHFDPAAFRLSALTVFLIPLVGAALISVYGYFEARDIGTEYITLTTPKLPANIERIRIVQISDVHLGLLVREERLGMILARVAEAKPDIFVSTGDLVDGQLAHLNGLAEMLRKIDAPLGRYAITGNHEFIVGIRQSIAFTEEAGFTVLRNSSVVVGDAINLAGVDDPAGRYYDTAGESPEPKMLGKLDRKRYTVLLKHRPLFDAASTGLFDLQLSGHVHKGQIFPFSLLTKLYYPKHAGLLPVNGSLIYASRGSGTWGPPMRFLAPPEVTIIDLVHDRNPAR